MAAAFRLRVTFDARAHSAMERLTPHQKHSILTRYRPHTRGAGFNALATRFAVRGGGTLIRRWYHLWDGTPQSLEPRTSPGRPALLSEEQVNRYIREPVSRAHQRRSALHYTTLTPSVRNQTHTTVSVQTVRRLGREALRARHRHTKKRTEKER